LTRRRLAFVAVAVAGLLVGCSHGDDAVAQGGTFEFVSPGGKTDIFYDPPDHRGRPGPVSGPELMDPARAVSVDDFAGKVVVINVWGQWCGPCRAEASALQQVYDATRANGVALLGIDVRDNNRQAAQDFVKDRKVTFPSIYDPAMRTMIAFGGKYPTSVIPSTLVLDRSHRVAAVFLRELLAENRRRRTAFARAGGVRPGRVGVVRVAVRGPAGARLLVVSGRRCRCRRSGRHCA
jgi:thiol-disulfide isomerase/thioredoxin